MTDAETRIRDGQQARAFLNAALVTDVMADIRKDWMAQILAVTETEPLKRDALRQGLVDQIKALDAVIARLRTVEALGVQEERKAKRSLA